MKFLPHTSNPLLLHLLCGGGLLKALPRPAVAPRVRRGEPCGTIKQEHTLLKGLAAAWTRFLIRRINCNKLLGPHPGTDLWGQKWSRRKLGWLVWIPPQVKQNEYTGKDPTPNSWSQSFSTDFVRANGPPSTRIANLTVLGPDGFAAGKNIIRSILSILRTSKTVFG